MFPNISFISMTNYWTKFYFITQYDIKRLIHRCICCTAGIWTKHKASQGDRSGKHLIFHGVVVEVSWLRANSDTQQQLPGTPGNTVFPLSKQWFEFSSLMRQYLNMKQKLALLMFPTRAAQRNTWQMFGQWCSSLHPQCSWWDTDTDSKKCLMLNICVGAVS